MGRQQAVSKHRRRRLFASVIALGLVLSACGGGGGDDGGTPTVRWYVFPEAAFEKAAATCNDKARGAYRIEIVLLPTTADGQREQLVRRLAAKDSDVDILGMDVIWTAEFAEAKWIREWTGADAREVSEDVFPAALRTATWKDKLYGATLNTNTQVLYYRKDRVPQPPRTWDEMIDMAERIGPHQGDNQIQGRRYDGLTVWLISLLASAGGEVLSGTDNVALGDPAVRALEVMRRVANSTAADPSLSNANEQTALLGYNAGTSSFQLNYTFAYKGAQTNAPEVFRNTGVARWPGVKPGEPSHVTVGGINLGIGAFSEHPQQAFDAAKCLRSADNQLMLAREGGLPPTIVKLYDHPTVREAFPFTEVLRDTLADATLRPQSPAYNGISLAIQRVLHPPKGIEPQEDAEELRSLVTQAINSEGLL